MVTTLKSYVCGAWVEGTGDRTQLVNPTTEEIIAEAGSGGVGSYGGGPERKRQLLAHEGATVRG